MKSNFSLLLVAALLVSCAGSQGMLLVDPVETLGPARNYSRLLILDHKNMADEGDIPEWLYLFIYGDIQEVEALDTYEDRHVFVSRNEGSNPAALGHWLEGFSAELDFPRLAAARIEERFISSVVYPDQEYGSFYEAMIRAASDAAWTGAVREDDFWIKWSTVIEPEWQDDPDQPDTPDTIVEAETDIMVDTEAEEEFLVFYVLVTIDRTLFASQLDLVFNNINPTPPPSRSQLAAANRVMDRFFDGF